MGLGYHPITSLKNSQENLVNNKIQHKKMIAGKLQLNLLRMNL